SLSYTHTSTTAPATSSLHDALPIYDDAKVAAARFLTADRVTDAYDEMVAEVGDSESLAHRVSQDIHRFMPVGNAAIESREVVCGDRKSTRLNSSHVSNSYAVFCLKK